MDQLFLNTVVFGPPDVPVCTILVPLQSGPFTRCYLTVSLRPALHTMYVMLLTPQGNGLSTGQVTAGASFIDPCMLNCLPGVGSWCFLRSYDNSGHQKNCGHYKSLFHNIKIKCLNQLSEMPGQAYPLLKIYSLTGKSRRGLMKLIKKMAFAHF
jgi:hypothetical protein